MAGKSIVDFCEDPLALNLKLWPKQKEILEQLWSGNYQTWVLALGRRSGKTLMSAVVAIYAAVVKAPQYKAFLRPGEPFHIITVANTESQSKIALQMITNLLKESPILKNLIIKETSDELWLSNGARFRALPASSRGARGLAVPVLIFDELGHAIDTENGNSSGKAVYESLSPSIAQFGTLGRTLLLSSPWVDSGVFYDMFIQAKSGDFPDMACVNLPSWEINPTLDKNWLAAQEKRDPAVFSREFGGVFSGSVNQFLDSELIDEAINPGRAELPPNPKYRGKYFLSLDPAKGGSGRDCYLACLIHYEHNKLVVDLWYEFPATYSGNKKREVNIKVVEDWIIYIHQKYGCKKIILDQHNSVGTIQRLQQHVAGSRASNRTIIDPYGRAPSKVNRGFPIEELTWTSASKCEAYSKMLELFNSGDIEIYPNPTAIKQLKNLRRLFKSNGDWTVAGSNGGGSIGGSAIDDYCAALAGAILIAQQENSSKVVPLWARSHSYYDLR